MPWRLFNYGSEIYYKNVLASKAYVLIAVFIECELSIYQESNTFENQGRFQFYSITSSGYRWHMHGIVPLKDICQTLTEIDDGWCFIEQHSAYDKIIPSSDSRHFYCIWQQEYGR